MCIEKANRYQFEEADNISFSKDPFKCYKYLLKNGSVQDFIILSNSTNFVAKAYGFSGIYSIINDERIRLIFLENNLPFKDKIFVKRFDLIYETNLGSLYLDFAFEGLSEEMREKIKLFIETNNLNHVIVPKK